MKRKFCVTYLLEWCVFIFGCCFVRVFCRVYVTEDSSVEAASILFVKVCFLEENSGTSLLRLLQKHAVLQQL